MAEATTEETRVRAWVMVHAEDPEWFADELYEALGTVGGDERVMVRADVVEANGSPYNVVIPVDAATEDDLQYIIDQMMERGAAEILTLRVWMDGHHPNPPHIAHGYITQGELEEQDRKGITLMEEIRLKQGRQGASPGHSPWG